MRKETLATQFQKTFILIVVSSIIASIITILISSFMLVISLNKTIYPPDFYEKQVPKIEEYIRSENENILSPSSESGLKNIIQGDGLLYQTIDYNGNILYGTFSSKPFENKEELLSDFMGSTVLWDQYYIRTVPVEKNGEFEGAVLLAYKIRMTFINTAGKLVATFFILSLFSPFIYLFGFTILFSKKYAKKINQPLQLLVDASRKVKNQDLDFEIDYHAENELGKLCGAFSEMQNELKKSLSTQWKLEQDRSEMVTALAHDLKSPLSIIMVYTDALIEDNPDGNEELKTFLKVIHENAEKSANLVKQMQYTSDLERYGSELNLESVNLSDFLKKKINEYEVQAHKIGVQLSWNMQDNVSDKMQIDTDKLARIFDNVISNSLQYTPEGGYIDIAVKIDEHTVSYKISDTGCGFSSKDLKKATERFYRGDEARQSKGNHSGLGLYIVKQLVDQLGGTLDIKNTETGGACVIFSHKRNL